MSEQTIGLLINGLWETLAMVAVSGAIAILFGLPLGVILLVTRKKQLFEGVVIHRSLAMIVNAIRSVPFIVLMVAITPLTRLIAGTSIGTVAAMVPLTLAAIPFFARLVESALNEVPHGLIEAAQAMGATPMQIITRVYIPEALPALIRGATITVIALVGYSAMAGAIGGGGLGDIAVRYGYQRFEIGVMIATVIILIVMVQLFQWAGDYLARYLGRHRQSFH